MRGRQARGNRLCLTPDFNLGDMAWDGIFGETPGWRFSGYCIVLLYVLFLFSKHVAAGAQGSYLATEESQVLATHSMYRGLNARLASKHAFSLCKFVGATNAKTAQKARDGFAVKVP